MRTLWWRKYPGAPPGDFQARASTWVQPPTFPKLAGWLPHIKDIDPGRSQAHIGEWQVILSRKP
jgi:hypothetical protein